MATPGVAEISGAETEMGTTSVSETENDLVERVQAGEQEAFTELIDRHIVAVRAFVSAKLPNPHLASEIVQEAFIFAYQNIQGFKAGGSFASWIRAIAWNLVRQERQRFAREMKNRERFLSKMEINAEASADDGLAEPGEQFAFLEDCLAALDPEHRRIIDLRYYQGMSAPEVAGALGMNNNAVRATLFRIRKRLKQCMVEKARRSPTP